MKIERVEIFPNVMQKDDPQWRFARGSSSDIKGFVVRISTDDGVFGLGGTNASPHTGSSYGGIKAVLDEFAGILIGHDPFNREKIFGTLDSTLHANNEAKAAIDMALHDLQGKALNLPVCTLLGGMVRTEIPVIRLLAIKEPSQVANNAHLLVEQGYKYLKIKVGEDPAKDVERVKEVRNAVGGGIHLTVDVNQGYSVKVAIETLKRMREYNIELAEQPVRADDWEGLAAVRKEAICPVEAHESARSVEQVFRLVKDRVVDSVNLVPVALGGLRNAREAAAICKAGNVSCRVSGMVSRVIAAAATHLAASVSNVSYACEIGEFSRFQNDLVTGLEVERGMVHLPSGPGLGIELAGQ